MNRFSRALYASVGAVLTCSVLLSACGGGGGDAPTQAAAVPSTSVAAPPLADSPATPGAAALQGAVPPIAGNAVLNTSFEQSPAAPWFGFAAQPTPPVQPVLIDAFADLPANTGSFYARLGAKPSEINLLVQQNITVPDSGESAALQFWYQIRTEELSISSSVFDKLEVLVAPEKEPGDNTVGVDPPPLLVLTNLDRDTNGWVKSPKLDLSVLKGRKVTIGFRSTQDASKPTRFYIDDVSIVATSPSTVEPETGWWLNAAEPGRGFAIEKQGDKIFMAGFFYGPTGGPVWNVALLAKQANGSYFGTFDRYSGGSAFSQSFKSASLTSKPFVLSLSFDAPDSGTLNVRESGGTTSRTFAIERFAFAAGKPASAANWRNGWWLNPAEPGSGYFFEAQGNQTFIGALSYLTDGNPTWYVSSGALGPFQSMAGPLDQYFGGQELLGPFKLSTKVPFTTANFAATFQTPFSGSLTITSAPAAKPLQRFVFN